MTVEIQCSDALIAPRSTPLPDGSSAGAAFACYSRLRTQVRTTRYRSRDLPSSSRDTYRRARRAGHGQNVFSEQLVTPRTTAAFVSEVVRRCPLHAVLESPENRRSPRRPKTGGDEEAGGHGARPCDPGRERAGLGFSRLFTPIRWSDLPGAQLVIASRTLMIREAAVGSSGHVRRNDPRHRTPSVTLVTWSKCREQSAAPRVMAARVCSIRVRFATPPGTAG